MKKLSLLSLILLCFQSGLTQSLPMNEDGFTAYFLEIIQKIHPEANYSIIDSLGVSAKLGEKEIKHYLDNAFREYKTNPEGVDAILSRYISSLDELYKENEAIRVDRIIPMIKPNSFLTILEEVNEKVALMYERYNDALIIVYMVDKQTSISSISTEEFQSLGIPTENLLKIAVRNLSQIIPPMERHGENGLYMVTAGGDYEVSLLLMTEIWTKENFPVDGEFVIAIPNRDMLMITGSNNAAGINRLREISSQSYKEGNHNITELLFIWNGKKFETLKD